jgi:hypothetical protein
MLSKLLFSERKALREALAYHAKLAFVAYCAERCIGEARRHAHEELAGVVNLLKSLDWLWQSVEGEHVDYHLNLADLHRTLDSFEPPSDDVSLAVGIHDISISNAMLCVDDGFASIRDQNFALLAVKRSFEGACSTVERIYQEGRSMADKEAAVLDESLRRLNALGGQPIRREMFADIPDYERSMVSPRYLRNHRRQAVEDEDDEA